MGFLKSLFGGSQPATPHVAEKEMVGEEYWIGDLLPQSSYLERIETQYLQSEGYARFRWTLHKYKEFLNQFADERFVFDGEVGSMCVVNFKVERDLTGYIQAGLYAETHSEVTDYEEKWGEPPKNVGYLVLHFKDGKPFVSVTKRNTALGEPYKWSNQNSKK